MTEEVTSAKSLISTSTLLQTMDAVVWAKEFMRIFGDRRNDIDEALMTSWFANAIMTGYDNARREEEG